MNGDIYYETEGVAPNRVFIVEWNNVAADFIYGGSNSLSFQAILYEGTNEIQFVYTPGPDDGSTFDNPSGSGLCAGLVDSNGSFVSIGSLDNSATVSSTTETDNINSPPADGLTFNFAIGPNAVALPASVADSTDVTLEGEVYPDNTNLTVYFLYRPESSFIYDSVAADQSPVNGSADVPVSAEISGIDPHTVYYYAVSIIGTGFYYRSSETVFHTEDQVLNGFDFSASNGTFNDISPTGTSVGLFDQDEGVQGGLPIGFTFYFDGTPFTEVFAASNGWLSFNSSSPSDGGYSFTGYLSGADANMLPFIGPLDADLFVNGGIYFETDGTAPNRTFTVQWDSVVGYGNSDMSTAFNQLSFQVILNESNGEIQIVYRQGSEAAVPLNTEDSPDAVGLEDGEGNFISVDQLSSSAIVSATHENDNVMSPPINGLDLSFTPTAYDVSLAVQATDFLVTPDVGAVTLSWRTQSEVGNAGFNILREDPQTSSFRIISSYTSNSSLKGLGTSSTGRDYTFTGSPVASGATYQYKIQSVSTSGVTKDLNTLTATVDVPKNYALYQNYPNPFNPSTTIRFDLKQASTVTLDIYNVLGQRVLEQNYATMNAGRYDRNINLDRFASGIYYYRITAEGDNGEKFVSVKKLALLK